MTWLADATSWQMWFIQLSGWPVFLAVIGAVVLFMIGMSVVLTRISHRSVLQNLALATAALTLLTLALLVLAALLFRSG